MASSRQLNIPMSGMTFPHRTFRDANPILYAVPFLVIRSQQVGVIAVGHSIWRFELRLIFRLSWSFWIDAGMASPWWRGNGKAGYQIRRPQYYSYFVTAIPAS